MERLFNWYVPMFGSSNVIVSGLVDQQIYDDKIHSNIGGFNQRFFYRCDSLWAIQVFFKTNQAVIFQGSFKIFSWKTIVDYICIYLEFEIWD